MILLASLEALEVKKIVVNRMGVREGVFLSDLLRNFNLKFPSNFKLNQRVLLDRFAEVPKVHNYYQNIANKLYDIVCSDKEYKEIVSFCSKLLLINSLNFYSWIEFLSFGYTHQEKVTIAYLMQSYADEELDEKLYKKYMTLLPSFKSLKELFFIFELTTILAQDMNIQKVDIKREDDTIYIDMQLSSLSIDRIKDLDSPYKITIRKK